MFRKPKIEAPTAVKDDFAQANDWEASRVYQIEKSERRAWLVAGTATAVAALAVFAVSMLTPLKESTPYVIRVDNVTGVPDIVTSIKDKEVTGDDVMDKYWLAQYVRARETFDWYTLQRDYTTVGMLSSPNVGAGYAQLFEGKDALDKTYGKSMRATIDIVSVVPTGRGTGTVRFIKTEKRTDQESAPGIVTKWIATIAYEYRSAAQTKETARLINPFGFQVLSYRADPEYVGGAQ